MVTRFVQHYNEVRLHGAIGYVTPKDWLEGRAGAIQAQWETRLRLARDVRATVRQATWEAAIAAHYDVRYNVREPDCRIVQSRGAPRAPEQG